MIDPDRLQDTLRAFISAPSPQEDMPLVRRFIADVVRPSLPLDHFDQVRLDEDGNLIAAVHGREARKPLLLIGYAATFPAGNMADAFVPREVDGTPHGMPGPCMQGRGVTEQVAPLAAAVEALRAFLADSPGLERGLLFVTSTAGEMGSHEVVAAMADRGDLDASCGLVLAGSNNAICRGNMGRVDIHVEVRGRSCHSSDPTRGVNALSAASELVQRLRHLPLGTDPDLGPASLTPTHFETWPKAMHTVPDLARLVYDRRLLPGDEVEPVVEQIREAARNLPAESVEVTVGKLQYPNKVGAEAEVPAALRNALLVTTGQAPHTYWRAALDGGFFTRRGIPTATFGPGDIRLAHTDYELVSIEQVVQAAEIYARALRTLCAPSE